MGIVVVGDTFVDIKGFSESTYIPAGRNLGSIVQLHGGVGRNVAEDIANVGLTPTFIGAADANSIGDGVVAHLQRQNVKTEYMKRANDSMGIWLAVFDHTGEVAASISKRPNHAPIVETLNEHGEEIFRAADSIALEIDMNQELTKRTFAYAEKYHKRVYALISNMREALKYLDYIRKTDCFVCNLQEAGMLFAEDYDNITPGELRAILPERMRRVQIPQMVVTMGADGSVYAADNGETGVCPALKVDVVDTTGAGDSFLAGVCIGLTYGKTLREACEIGTRMAATVVGKAENVCAKFRAQEFDITL